MDAPPALIVLVARVTPAGRVQTKLVYEDTARRLVAAGWIWVATDPDTTDALKRWFLTHRR